MLNTLFDNRKTTKALFFIGLLILTTLSCGELPAVDPTEFASLDLSDKDFSNQIIRGYDLSGKNLQNTNFSYAKLIGIDFTESDLRGAVFDSTEFIGVNFIRADLRDAKLGLACGLEKANWTDALLDIKWSKVVALFKDGELITKDLRGYDLSGVCIYYADTTGVDFSNANLENAILAGSVMDAIFYDTNLRFVNLGGKDLKGVDFTGADVTGVDFAWANLTGAKITFEQLQTARLSCTRLPDGTLYDDEGCYGVTPVPP